MKRYSIIVVVMTMTWCLIACGKNEVTSAELEEKVSIGEVVTARPEATVTPTPEATAAPAPEATATPTPEATATPTPEATATPTPEATATPTPEATATPTPEATATPTPEATATPTPEATATPTPEPIVPATPQLATAEDFEYEIRGSEVILWKYIGDKTAVILPSYIEGIPATIVAAYAFQGCKHIENIVIPEGYELTGNMAFDGCDNLKEITWPASMVVITNAFFPKGQEVTFKVREGSYAQTYAKDFLIKYELYGEPVPPVVLEPATAEEFDYEVRFDSVIIWSYSGDKKAIILPEKIEDYPVDRIAGYAFSQQYQLEQVVIPEGYLGLGYGVFQACVNLKEVTLPESLVEMYEGIFAGASNVVLKVKEGSYAQSYAEQYGLNYEFY